ncbi:MAG: hypothetical protein ACOYMB_02120 [Patescibacteria group bacterium]
MNYRKYQSKRLWLHVLSAPFIWLPLPFIILVDLLSALYQAICFPIYKIERVKRSEYILIFDRNKLAYLNGLEKLGCMYCGYANGVFLYLKEVAGRTEKYWCGIMHENKPGFKIQEDQVKQDFAKFGDQEDFQKKYKTK